MFRFSFTPTNYKFNIDTKSRKIDTEFATTLSLGGLHKKNKVSFYFFMKENQDTTHSIFRSNSFGIQ